MRVLLIIGPAMAGQGAQLTARLSAAGLEVELGQAPGAGEDWHVDADILAGPGWLPCDSALFQRSPRLRRLVAIGIGTEGFDRAEAARRGIDVRNGATRENVQGMASATILLMMALAHRLPDAVAACRAGGRRAMAGVRSLDDMVVGLIGYGAIGSLVAARLRAWGIDVRAYSPSRRPGTAQDGVSFMELDALLAACDLISLHAALNRDTYGLLGARRLEGMKPGALLVNTARGGLVDEVALAQALGEGRIGGAALDCFAQEPLPVDHPLWDAPNAILTPHQIGHTQAGQASVMERFVANIIAPLPALPS